ncbi:flagellar hook-basal body complex protein [Sedimentibacter sp. zth1]|uniref:flagellar hook-basal body complex protein n=1 Tax=Sedimentibacter sp. zth1 TaxID=2816908 RepID=UPI001A929DCF|nr:flagellar hook-basal body complex protein [Sedimentibacter sp. zth1]QSX07195.1 flagellar hook-basal body complex protein [Sedimentibacter sp. zth1]
MMRSLYSGVAGLRAHQTRMDVVGNNIANVNTYAYKSQRVTFRDMYYQTIRSSSEGVNATQLGYGAQVGSIDTLHVQSGYAPTDRPMDIYIDGEGFIAVEDPNGGNMFTRIGALSFMPTSNGTTFRLVDINGNSVKGAISTITPGTPPTTDYGAKLNNDEVQLEEIIIPDFNKYTNISIGGNGHITGIDDKGNVLDLATIGIAKISNAEGLTMQGSSYFKSINNTGDITYNVPGKNGVGSLVPGALEMSNVDLAKEFTDMITTQRGYQANSRIITVVDEMLQELVNLKR